MVKEAAMKLGRKLAMGVVEEAERISEFEIMREDAGVPPQGEAGTEAEACKPSEDSPRREEREEFVGNAVDA
jgi:hypothetical protein